MSPPWVDVSNHSHQPPRQCDYKAMKTQHAGSDDLDETDFDFDEYEDFEELEDEFGFGEGGG